MFPALVIGCLVLGLLFAPDYLTVPTLFIPDRLGLLQRVTEDQLAIVTISGSVPEFQVAQAGIYVLLDRSPSPRVPVLMSKETGRRIALYQMNAINLYGTSHLAGVPLGQFIMDKPGEILIANMPPEASYIFALAPDFVGRNNTTIILSFILHVLILAVVIGIVYYGLNRNRIRREKSARSDKRAKFDQWTQ